VPAHNFHVTLAFIGSVPEGRLPEVVAVAEQVSREVEQAAVELRFDDIDYWKKARIACATASGPSPVAAALAEALKSKLTAGGFTPDLKPFRAHVTLARKVPRGGHGREMPALLWRFTQFALVESRTESDGPVYHVIGSWPIGR